MMFRVIEPKRVHSHRKTEPLAICVYKRREGFREQVSVNMGGELTSSCQWRIGDKLSVAVDLDHDLLKLQKCVVGGYTLTCRHAAKHKGEFRSAQLKFTIPHDDDGSISEMLREMSEGPLMWTLTSRGLVIEADGERREGK